MEQHRICLLYTSSQAASFDEFSSLLLREGVTVKESRGRLSYLTDVYNRQVQGIPRQAERPHPSAAKPGRVQRGDQQDRHPWSGTVSYTHLDVYKRQISPLPPRRLIGSAVGQGRDSPLGLRLDHAARDVQAVQVLTLDDQLVDVYKRQKHRSAPAWLIRGRKYTAG